MPKKRRSAPSYRATEEIGRLLNKAGDNAIVRSYSDYVRTEVPGGDTSNDAQKIESFRKARIIAKTNYWLRGFIPVKISVLNYGLNFFAAGPAKGKSKTKRTSKDQEKLDEWLDTPQTQAAATISDQERKTIGVASGAEITNRERILKFIEDAWDELVVVDNCIGAWMDSHPLPVILPPELCRYKDVLGIETLFYRHGISEVDRKLLSPEDQERFKEAEILFDPEQGEYFKVLKFEKTGSGLSWPKLHSIFRTHGTMESMEMGESAYAFAGRMKFRHWKKGYQITNGPMAGKPVHHWKKENSKMIQGVFENKEGFLGDFCSNFDFELAYPHEAVEYFDEDKWKSPEHRLIQWGGPLAQIIADKGRAADLLHLLKAEALYLRGKMKGFLESVLNQAFDIPVKLQVDWSNTIFLDVSTFANQLNHGLTAGPLSQSTWRQEAGFNDEVEAFKKEQEAAEFEKNPQKFKPAFDSAHGDPDDKGGAPTGKKHKDSRNQE